jgi:hypothetical protein
MANVSGPKSIAMVMLLGAYTVVCAQEQQPSGATPPSAAATLTPLSQQAQSVPDPAQYPLPPPGNSCSNQPCLQSYTPPPLQPPTQFNWNAACGSLSTEGGLIGMVPGGQGAGAALGAAGVACKAGVAAGKDGPNGAAAETAKEVLTAGAEAAATQATGSELAGKIAGEGAGVVMDAGQDLAAQPGDSSFICAKVGQCPGADSGTTVGPGSQNVQTPPTDTSVQPSNDGGAPTPQPSPQLGLTPITAHAAQPQNFGRQSAGLDSADQVPNGSDAAAAAAAAYNSSQQTLIPAAFDSGTPTGKINLQITGLPIATAVTVPTQRSRSSSLASSSQGCDLWASCWTTDKATDMCKAYVATRGPAYKPTACPGM